MMILMMGRKKGRRRRRRIGIASEEERLRKYSSDGNDAIWKSAWLRNIIIR